MVPFFRTEGDAENRVPPDVTNNYQLAFLTPGISPL